MADVVVAAPSENVVDDPMGNVVATSSRVVTVTEVAETADVMPPDCPNPPLWSPR